MSTTSTGLPVSTLSVPAATIDTTKDASGNVVNSTTKSVDHPNSPISVTRVNTPTSDITTNTINTSRNFGDRGFGGNFDDNFSNLYPLGTSSAIISSSISTDGTKYPNPIYTPLPTSLSTTYRLRRTEHPSLFGESGERMSNSVTYPRPLKPNDEYLNTRRRSNKDLMENMPFSDFLDAEGDPEAVNFSKEGLSEERRQAAMVAESDSRIEALEQRHLIQLQELKSQLSKYESHNSQLKDKLNETSIKNEKISRYNKELNDQISELTQNSENFREEIYQKLQEDLTKENLDYISSLIFNDADGKMKELQQVLNSMSNLIGLGDKGAVMPVNQAIEDMKKYLQISSYGNLNELFQDFNKVSTDLKVNGNPADVRELLKSMTKIVTEARSKDSDVDIYNIPFNSEEGKAELLESLGVDKIKDASNKVSSIGNDLKQRNVNLDGVLKLDTGDITKSFDEFLQTTATAAVVSTSSMFNIKYLLIAGVVYFIAVVIFLLVFYYVMPMMSKPDSSLTSKKAKKEQPKTQTLTASTS